MCSYAIHWEGGGERCAAQVSEAVVPLPQKTPPSSLLVYHNFFLTLPFRRSEKLVTTILYKMIVLPALLQSPLNRQQQWTFYLELHIELCLSLWSWSLQLRCQWPAAQVSGTLLFRSPIMSVLSLHSKILPLMNALQVLLSPSLRRKTLRWKTCRPPFFKRKMKTSLVVSEKKDWRKLEHQVDDTILFFFFKWLGTFGRIGFNTLPTYQILQVNCNHDERYKYMPIRSQSVKLSSIKSFSVKSLWVTKHFLSIFQEGINEKITLWISILTPCKWDSIRCYPEYKFTP